MKKETLSVISSRITAVTLTLPLLTGISSPEAIARQAPSPKTTDTSTNFIDQINKLRKKHDLPPVHKDKETCDFAQTRAEEITKNFSHDGFIERMENNSLPYKTYTFATENIQMNNDKSTVVDLWINSTDHKKNLLADTPELCIKGVEGKDPDGNTTFFWAMEGKRE